MCSYWLCLHFYHLLPDPSFLPPGTNVLNKSWHPRLHLRLCFPGYFTTTACRRSPCEVVSYARPRSGHRGQNYLRGLRLPLEAGVCTGHALLHREKVRRREVHVWEGCRATSQGVQTGVAGRRSEKDSRVHGGWLGEGKWNVLSMENAKNRVKTLENQEVMMKVRQGRTPPC